MKSWDDLELIDFVRSEKFPERILKNFRGLDRQAGCLYPTVEAREKYATSKLWAGSRDDPDRDEKRFELFKVECMVKRSGWELWWVVPFEWVNNNGGWYNEKHFKRSVHIIDSPSRQMLDEAIKSSAFGSKTVEPAEARTAQQTATQFVEIQCESPDDLENFMRTLSRVMDDPRVTRNSSLDTVFRTCRGVGLEIRLTCKVPSDQ